MYADDAGVVSKSAEGFAKRMTVIVTVFEAAGFPISGNKTKRVLLQTPGQTTLASPPVIEAAGQRYRQTAQLLYLGNIINENADLSIEIDRRIRLMRACLKRFGLELYDRTTVPPSLN